MAAIIRRFASGLIVDPFSGRSTIATLRNDLAHGGVDAREWLRSLVTAGVRADCALLDPPYSPRQMSECYKSVGLKVGMKGTQNAVLYSDSKDLLTAILKPGGIAITCGWNSGGFGKNRGFELLHVLLVAHGGAHNDTIVVVERKIRVTYADGTVETIPQRLEER